MITLNDIRKKPQGVLVLGNHPGIVQSILDFDYACGKSEPSIVACITSNRKSLKFFFGKGEVLIPCFQKVTDVPQALAAKVNWMLNVQSGRRAFDSTIAFFDAFSDAYGGHIFAENVPSGTKRNLLKSTATQKSSPAHPASAFWLAATSKSAQSAAPALPSLNRVNW